MDATVSLFLAEVTRARLPLLRRKLVRIAFHIIKYNTDFNPRLLQQLRDHHHRITTIESQGERMFGGRSNVAGQ